MSDKKQRVAHLNSTVCYLKKDNKVLMIKFTKKWVQVYAPHLFKEKLFEGKFLLDEKCNVLEYEIRTI